MRIRRDQRCSLRISYYCWCLLCSNLESGAGGWLAGLGDIDADRPRAAHREVDLCLVDARRLWSGGKVIGPHLFHCLHCIIECDVGIGDELLALALHDLERDAGGLVDRRWVGADLECDLVGASLGRLDGCCGTARHDRIQHGADRGHDD